MKTKKTTKTKVEKWKKSTRKINAPGAVRGNRGVRGRRGRGRERANPTRITRKEQERPLEAKWTSVDQDPQTLQFSATPGIQVPLQNEPSAVDFMKRFFD